MKIQNVQIRLVREAIGEYKESISITSPRAVTGILNQLFDMENRTNEIFVALFLDTKNTIVGAEKISEGTINASIISPRELFQRAFVVNACSILIAHNHPSGVTTPSPEDIAVTKRMQKASDIMGIHLLDHIIIGDNRYTSLKEEGHLN